MSNLDFTPLFMSGNLTLFTSVFVLAIESRVTCSVINLRWQSLCRISLACMLFTPLRIEKGRESSGYEFTEGVG